MSGTSMDAVDACAVEVSASGDRVRLHTAGCVSRGYPAALRGRLEEACSGQPATAADHAALSIAVGKVFATAARAAIRKAGRAFAPIDAVASHGQTIVHQPGRQTLTAQIGDPNVIAEATGVTVVSDFRTADTVAGGEGAPLVPYVHWLLLRHPGRARVIQNIGGMGNATILPAGGELAEVRGTDTGPGNLLIDECVRRLSSGRLRMDRGGRLAARGFCDERLVSRILRAAFFHRALPASTGREDFGPDLASELVALGRRWRLDDASIVASVTMATARSIARSLERLGAAVDEVLVCGGGARNRTLLAMLAEVLPNGRVGTTAALGFDPAFVEAQAFAVLGFLALKGRPANIPAVTGASGPRVLGRITPGRNYRRTVLD